MNRIEQDFYDDLNIVLDFGEYEINIVHIAFLGPRPNWKVSQHNHLGFELHYIPTGKGKVLVGKNNYDILPNTCYLVGPNVDHEQIADAIDPMSEYGLNFEVSLKPHHIRMNKEHDMTRDKELSILVKSLTKTQFWFGEEAVFMKSFFESLEYELIHQFTGYYINVQNMLSSIIIHLVRTCAMQEKADYKIPGKTLDSRRSEMIHSYLSTCFLDASREKLAKELCISIRQLSREINLLYNGQTFGEVLTKVRLSHALELLITPDHSIEEVALMIGFSSASYFSKVFKKEYHMTPEQYRNGKNGT